MAKVENTIKVLRLLRKNGSMKARELSEELDIEIRMIRRYVDILIKCGYDIEKRTGRYTGGYTLHEITLSNDEYAALYEAKTLIEKEKPYLLEAYQKALEKINYRLNDSI